MGRRDSAAYGFRGTGVEMTEFKYSILFALAEGSNYGLGIKQDLQDYYGFEINHGKLYPNLDELAIDGLIEKGQRDNRTNDYSITAAGLETAVERLEWAIDRLVSDEAAADSLAERIRSEVLPS